MVTSAQLHSGWGASGAFTLPTLPPLAPLPSAEAPPPPPPPEAPSFHPATPPPTLAPPHNLPGTSPQESPSKLYSEFMVSQSSAREDLDDIGREEGRGHEMETDGREYGGESGESGIGLVEAEFQQANSNGGSVQAVADDEKPSKGSSSSVSNSEDGDRDAVGEQDDERKEDEVIGMGAEAAESREAEIEVVKAEAETVEAEAEEVKPRAEAIEAAAAAPADSDEEIEAMSSPPRGDDISESSSRRSQASSIEDVGSPSRNSSPVEPRPPTTPPPVIPIEGQSIPSTVVIPPTPGGTQEGSAVIPLIGDGTQSADPVRTIRDSLPVSPPPLQQTPSHRIGGSEDPDQHLLGAPTSHAAAVGSASEDRSRPMTRSRSASRSDGGTLPPDASRASTPVGTSKQLKPKRRGGKRG